MAVGGFFGEAAECQVGMDSTVASVDSTLGGAGITRATMTFAFDNMLLANGGFAPLLDGSGGFQQPYWPFGSAMLAAPAGFEFPDGFPFANGGMGIKPLGRRLANRQLGTVITTTNTATFRVQTTDIGVSDNVQMLLATQVSAMMMKMQVNTALNMQMFSPTAPLTQPQVQALIMAVSMSQASVLGRERAGLSTPVSDRCQNSVACRMHSPCCSSAAAPS